MGEGAEVVELGIFRMLRDRIAKRVTRVPGCSALQVLAYALDRLSLWSGRSCVGRIGG
jgi:hypothetical protein